MPVGRWESRTALSVLFRCWPPGPLPVKKVSSLSASSAGPGSASARRAAARRTCSGSGGGLGGGFGGAGGSETPAGGGARFMAHPYTGRGTGGEPRGLYRRRPAWHPPAVSRRAGISPSDDRRWVFNRLAADYAARPAYPTPLVARLVELAGGPGRRAADLGAGVGHLALPLALRGLEVAAVEPARAMLDALAAARAGLAPGLAPVHAAAEATGLPAGTFDLVLLADALQWVDPEGGAAEVRRLLAAGGALAVVSARLLDTPFLRALGERIAAENPKARPAPPPVELFFSLCALPAPAEERFLEEQELSPGALEAVLRSLSYVGPALGPSRLEALLGDARALAAEHGGALWARELRLAWARRAARPG